MEGVKVTSDVEMARVRVRVQGDAVLYKST